MKLMVTGACGLVGRAIVEAADRFGHEIVAVDIVDEVVAIGGIRADVTDRDAMLRAAEGCQAIVHTAAMHGGDRNKASNQAFIQANVIGAENLFEAAITHGIRRCVFSSTYEVLCGFKWNASGITVYDDKTPPRPDWIYPVSKLMVEELGHFHAREHGLEVVQLRYAWVRSAPIEEVGLGLLARSVAASDVADANLLACTAPHVRDEVLLIGPDTPLDMKDIVQALTDPWAVLERHWPGCTPILKEHQIEPAFDHFWPAARIDRARQAIGWQPRVTFERYLRMLGWRRPDDEAVRRHARPAVTGKAADHPEHLSQK